MILLLAFILRSYDIVPAEVLLRTEYDWSLADISPANRDAQDENRYLQRQ